MTTSKTVRCDSHGEIPWEGHVACSSCGAVFQTENEKAARYAPRVCPCGHRLMPAKNRIGEALPFSARVVCGTCYRAKVEGETPSEEPIGARFPKLGLKRRSFFAKSVS